MTNEELNMTKPKKKTIDREFRNYKANSEEATQ